MVVCLSLQRGVVGLLGLGFLFVFVQVGFGWGDVRQGRDAGADCVVKICASADCTLLLHMFAAVGDRQVWCGGWCCRCCWLAWAVNRCMPSRSLLAMALTV